MRPYRLTVRTPAFQAVNPGSIPGRVMPAKSPALCGIFLCVATVTTWIIGNITSSFQLPFVNQHGKIAKRGHASIYGRVASVPADLKEHPTGPEMLTCQFRPQCGSVLIIQVFRAHASNIDCDLPGNHHVREPECDCGRSGTEGGNR